MWRMRSNEYSKRVDPPVVQPAVQPAAKCIHTLTMMMRSAGFARCEGAVKSRRRDVIISRPRGMRRAGEMEGLTLTVAAATTTGGRTDGRTSVMKASYRSLAGSL